MAKVVTRTRRRRPADRRLRAAAALTAAGVQIVPTYDTLYGSEANRRFQQEALDRGLNEVVGDGWPTEAVELADMPGQVYRDGNEAVYVLADDVVVFVRLGWDAIVRVASKTRDDALQCCLTFRDVFPPAFVVLDSDGPPMVPITFWSLGPHGPERRLRRIEIAEWDSIVGNYSTDVRDQIDQLMSGFVPGGSGQLLLWQGPPGTGKTWALRALASQWAEWAEFHYITDPDAFFVDAPSYMVDVLLADSYEAIDVSSGDRYLEGGDGKWRVLILEDTGELLSADAKEKYGQGLSRLLNVVDGMIGQGLKVLALVTTNDELGELNPAVLRPGRCASQIVFGPLDPDTVRAHGVETDEPMTLAEVYAELKSGADPLAASADAFLVGAADVTRIRIGEVAAKHQPDDPSYGQTWYRESDGRVFWAGWDGTSPEEEEAAFADFLAIPGVTGVEGDAESLPDGDGWERVYATVSSARDGAVTHHDAPAARQEAAGRDAALEEVIRLAREPLDLDDPPSASETVVDDIAATLAASVPPGAEVTSGAIFEALRVVAESHRTTVEAIGSLVAAAAPTEAARGNDALVLATLATLGKFAERPAPAAAAAPDVHVHVPAHDLRVNVESPDVHVAVPAPHVDVHVPEQRQVVQPPPVVHFHAPEPVTAAAPDVHVHLPEQPAPTVNVEVSPAAPPRPKAVRVEVDEFGVKHYISEEVPA